MEEHSVHTALRDRILTLLAAHGGGLCMALIATELGVSQVLLAKAVHRLVDRGMVRLNGAKARQNTLVELTDR